MGMTHDASNRRVHAGTWPQMAGHRVVANMRWGQAHAAPELCQTGSAEIDALLNLTLEWVRTSAETDILLTRKVRRDDIPQAPPTVTTRAQSAPTSR
jgi:hypothetical protein